MEKIKVTEESGIQNKWREEANTVTMETLVHAISAAVGATIKAMNDSEQGGITGFQAGCLMWEILQNEFHIMWPCAITKYEDMLFPQYEDNFTSITPEVWSHLRKQATLKLENEPYAAERVKRHWETISKGVVPFGYRVRLESPAK